MSKAPSVATARWQYRSAEVNQLTIRIRDSGTGRSRGGDGAARRRQKPPSPPTDINWLDELIKARVRWAHLRAARRIKSNQSVSAADLGDLTRFSSIFDWVPRRGTGRNCDA